MAGLEGGGQPPQTSSAPAASTMHKSYARMLAETNAFPKVDIPVHAPAFTDRGEPAVFFTTEALAFVKGSVK